MKKNHPVDGGAVDALERAALGGRINRRDFVSALIALGVGATTAGEMAAHAETASANQQTQLANLRDEYDYIIVGAGSAGCVLANRISATGASVLLIEAGGDDIAQPKISNSLLSRTNLFTETDWARITTPQAGFANRRTSAAGGRIWGGSGSINSMIWLRGDKRDWRLWRSLVGHRWNPRAIRRAFLRTETFVPGAPHRGTNGPITVNRFAPAHVLTPAYLAAGQELGLQEIELNAGRRLDGIGVADFNILADGRRAGPAHAYLVPALVRPNLTVLSNTLVTGLDLRRSRCRGVNAVVNGASRTFSAAQEVILAAGALESPKLLLLSGIGDAAQLSPVGIPVCHELPAVGQNFHDHVLLANVVFRAQGTLPRPVFGGVSAFAYFRTSARTAAPDVEVMCMQLAAFTSSPPPGGGFSVIPYLSKPRSRGSVFLQSADATVPLGVDPAYLVEAIDRDNMIMGLDRAIDIGLTNALAPFSAGLFSPAARPVTRDDKLAFIAANAQPGFHFVGSCAAGTNPDASVVDQRFRVWGIDSLRIVDGSVIPEVPAANSHVSILTLAELAAEQMGFLPGAADALRGDDAAGDDDDDEDDDGDDD
ncbi:GMC family oxidoreductase [Sorangium sp. So ce1000]|uniref:GMC family oxidoreductase n=1 Tax=Sorangium sp. So ce1000 TaxID=3133325 RepID=UPI003F5E58BC